MSEGRAKDALGYTFAIDLAAVAVALLLGHLGKGNNDVRDWIATSGVLFLVWRALKGAWDSARMKADALQEVRLARIRSPVDHALLEVQDCYRRIAEQANREDDLFVDYFRLRVREIRDAAVRAADECELRVVEHHFQSVENVMSAFLGDSERRLRYVWRPTSNNRLFDEVSWQRYFELIHEVVASESIIEVRALLILEASEQYNEPRIQALLAYFKHTKNQNCRCISGEMFDGLCRKASLDRRFVDFGIYGESLLFRTETYEPEPEGVFSKDRNLVNKYRKFFDNVWKSTLSSPNPSTSQVSEWPTAESLIRFDTAPGAPR